MQPNSPLSSVKLRYPHPQRVQIWKSREEVNWNGVADIGGRLRVAVWNRGGMDKRLDDGANPLVGVEEVAE